MTTTFQSASIAAGLCLVLCSTNQVASGATVIYNFGSVSPFTAAPTSGTTPDFTAGSFSIANSFGTVATPLSSTSASTTYAGASGTGNIGNAVNAGVLNTGTTAYYTVTLTPSAGNAIEVTGFNFGTRSTASGPVTYSLRSSLDSFASQVVGGAIANDSSWSLKTNTFSITGGVDTPITLRLYTFGSVGSPASGTINSRVDDVALTAQLVPEISSAGLALLAGLGLLRRRR